MKYSLADPSPPDLVLQLTSEEAKHLEVLLKNLRALDKTSLIPNIWTPAVDKTFFQLLNSIEDYIEENVDI